MRIKGDVTAEPSLTSENIYMGVRGKEIQGGKGGKSQPDCGFESRRAI